MSSGGGHIKEDRSPRGRFSGGFCLSLLSKTPCNLKALEAEIASVERFETVEQFTDPIKRPIN